MKPLMLDATGIPLMSIGGMPVRATSFAAVSGNGLATHSVEFPLTVDADGRHPLGLLLNAVGTKGQCMEDTFVRLLETQIGLGYVLPRSLTWKVVAGEMAKIKFDFSAVAVDFASVAVLEDSRFAPTRAVTWNDAFLNIVGEDGKLLSDGRDVTEIEVTIAKDGNASGRVILYPCAKEPPLGHSLKAIFETGFRIGPKDAPTTVYSFEFTHPEVFLFETRYDAMGNIKGYVYSFGQYEQLSPKGNL